MELFNKALVAASVAESGGFSATSLALREIAAWLYTEVLSAKDRETPYDDAHEFLPEQFLDA